MTLAPCQRCHCVKHTWRCATRSGSLVEACKRVFVAGDVEHYSLFIDQEEELEWGLLAASPPGHAASVPKAEGRHAPALQAPPAAGAARLPGDQSGGQRGVTRSPGR